MSQASPAAGILPPRSAASVARGAVPCAHCGATVPRALVQPAGSQSFCCDGCRAVYEVISELGLTEYYRLRERTGAAASPAAAAARRYEEFDDPDLAAMLIAERPDGLAQIDLLLEGMHCGACVWLIERLPIVLPGVREARVDLGRRTVRILWDRAALTPGRIARTIASLGYRPHPARGRDVAAMRRAENRRGLIRIAVAGAIAGNVMVMAFALYGGMMHGIEASYARAFHWISLALTCVSLAGPGQVFLRGFIAAVRTRRMHMDVPVSIGLVAGFVGSAIETIRGGDAIYFDSLSILVFLLLVGRFVQTTRQRAAQEAIESLFALTPVTAQRLDPASPPGEHRTQAVPIDAIVPGDHVLVRAGDSVPVDGAVVEGESDLDQSLLTGEPLPVAVGPGDEVHAGTVNQTAAIVVRVRAAGEATRVGALMRLVESCASERSGIVMLADRIAGRFVIAVLVLALLCACLWLVLEPGAALPNTIALLIITCPCALGLATPLAIVAGIGRAARNGLLIKGGDVIERLATPGTILLDKTGTITEGRMTVVRWEGDPSLRAPVAALEAQSSHPVARALAAMLPALETAPDAPMIDGISITRNGASGTIDARRVAVGDGAFHAASGSRIPAAMQRAMAGLAADGLTPVLVAVDGTVAAVAGIGDPIKPDAASTIRTLTQRGWRVGVLSGDHPDVVARVASAVGIRDDAVFGGVSPERKLEIVQTRLAHGPVVMAGDGVNDAAALAAATVGIAVHGGAEASLAAADVHVAVSGLTPIAHLVDGARRTLHVIRRNIVVSLGYNVVGVTLAMTGLINPIVAAILMPVSSLTVVTLSFRSRTFDPPRTSANGPAPEATPPCP